MINDKSNLNYVFVSPTNRLDTRKKVVHCELHCFLCTLGVCFVLFGGTQMHYAYASVSEVTKNNYPKFMPNIFGRVHVHIYSPWMAGPYYPVLMSESPEVCQFSSTEAISTLLKLICIKSSAKIS